MTLLSVLFPGELLISRKFYTYIDGTPVLITAPPKAGIVRVSLVGGGAKRAGGAFARVKAACTPGEQFSLDVGRGSLNGGGGGSDGEDSTFTRVTGSVLLARAEGATSGGPAGLAANSVGDVTRSGTQSASIYFGGDSAGDDEDPYPLGFGGLGSYENRNPGNGNRYAYPGAGGTYDVNIGEGVLNDIHSGHGRAAVEFFISDPGY